MRLHVVKLFSTVTWQQEGPDSNPEVQSFCREFTISLQVIQLQSTVQNQKNEMLGTRRGNLCTKDWGGGKSSKRNHQFLMSKRVISRCSTNWCFLLEIFLFVSVFDWGKPRVEPNLAWISGWLDGWMNKERDGWIVLWLYHYMSLLYFYSLYLFFYFSSFLFLLSNNLLISLSWMTE